MQGCVGQDIKFIEKVQLYFTVNTVIGTFTIFQEGNLINTSQTFELPLIMIWAIMIKGILHPK